MLKFNCFYRKDYLRPLGKKKRSHSFYKMLLKRFHSFQV